MELQTFHEDEIKNNEKMSITIIQHFGFYGPNLVQKISKIIQNRSKMQLKFDITSYCENLADFWAKFAP